MTKCVFCNLKKQLKQQITNKEDIELYYDSEDLTEEQEQELIKIAKDSGQYWVVDVFGYEEAKSSIEGPHKNNNIDY